MDNKNMKFLRVSDRETANKLRHEGYTEIPSQDKDVYYFMNNGKKLNFDVEKFGGVYTNILCL